MEFANHPIEQREFLERILQAYADLPYRYGEVLTYDLNVEVKPVNEELFWCDRSITYLGQ